MQRERVSTTTPVLESHDKDMAVAVDAITPASYSDVRGTVEIDASFASHSFIKDLHEAPAYTNQFTDDAFLARVGNQAIIPVVTAPKKHEVSTVARRELAKQVEHGESVSKKMIRGLGATALMPIRAVRKVNQAATNFNVEVLSRIPGFDSKEEKLEKMRERDEKYMIRENDSVWTRTKKRMGRNAFKAAAWTMPALMGLAAGGMMARGIADWSGAFAHHIPYEALPFETKAKTSFYIPGRGDIDGSQYVNYAKATGTYDPSAINRTAHYSASIAPLDPERMDVSTNVAADQMVQAYHDAKGGPFEVHAFSEGTVAAVEGLKKLEAQGVDMSKVTLYVDGGPKGVMGMYNSPYARAVSPVLDSLGINPSTDIPAGAKVIVRSYSGDLWGMGGNQSGAMQLAMAGTIGSNHRPIEGNAILINERVIDGITYQEFAYPDGLVNPISEALSANGAYVSPAGDRLIDSILPVTHLGEPTQYANAGEVKDAAADFISDTILRNNGVDAAPVVHQVTDAVMTPERTAEAQSMLELTKLPDEMAAIANDPASAPQRMQNINNITTNALNTATSYINDPNKAINAINDGLRGGGVPVQVPQFEQIQQIATQVFQPPRASAPVAPRLNVPTTPINHAPVFTPAPTPAPAPAQFNPGPQMQQLNTMVQQGLSMFSQMLAPRR